MNKLLSTAALALCLAAGSAMAQEAAPAGVNTNTPAADTGSTDTATTNSTSGNAGMRTDFASDDERAWYETNAAWARPFFTDDTMSTLKSDEEAKAVFAAMGADSQAGMKAACEQANSSRGSYGSVTTSLCASVGL